MSARKPEGGFTLLEVLIALVVLGIAGMEAVAGLSAAEQCIKTGQLRQAAMALLDAKAQRYLLTDRSALLSSVVPLPATSPDQLAVGRLPWVPDSYSAGVQGDLGNGPYFVIKPNGFITALQPGTPDPATHINIPVGTACGSSLIPPGVYCREVLLTQGLPPTSASTALNQKIVSAGGTAYTYWIRISRSGAPDSVALLQREVFTQ